MEHYIGLDAHSQSCTFVTVDSKGVEKSRLQTSTSESNILKYIRSHQGKVALTFEESSMSRWLFSFLKKEVVDLQVCNPSYLPRKGPVKTDYKDALHLAQTLRMGGLVTVYHDNHNEFLELRSLVSAYGDLVCDIVRNKNRLKSLFRAEAISTTGKNIFKTPDSISCLSLEVDKISADALMYQIQVQSEVQDRYLEIFEANLKKLPVLKQLTTIPGIATVRANIIGALICDGRRFPNKHHLWSYCGLVRHLQISDGRVYGQRQSWGRPELKCVYMGAAESVLMTQDNGLRRHYDRLRSQGLDHRKAKKAIARKIASISLVVMKTGKPYNDQWEEKNKTIAARKI
jgi:transposase